MIIVSELGDKTVRTAAVAMFSLLIWSNNSNSVAERSQRLHLHTGPAPSPVLHSRGGFLTLPADVVVLLAVSPCSGLLRRRCCCCCMSPAIAACVGRLASRRSGAAIIRCDAAPRLQSSSQPSSSQPVSAVINGSAVLPPRPTVSQQPRQSLSRGLLPSSPVLAGR